jgi:hypothetical protein
MSENRSSLSTERVFYMDRNRNIIITDQRVVIGQRRFATGDLKRARVESKHTGHELQMEIAMKALIPVAAVACLVGRFLMEGTRQGTTLFGLSAAALAVCGVVLLLLTLAGKTGQALVLLRSNGRSEEIILDGDRHLFVEVAHAIQAALGSAHGRH